MKIFNKIAIVGVGLIGGSLGLAIKKNGISNQVLGVFRRKKTLNQAMKKRAVDKASMDLRSVKDADLIILSGPVSVILKQLPVVFRLAKQNAVIMDTGSTKFIINETAKKLIKKRNDLIFIGAHPLAGLEKKGVASARADLFKDSICIICPIASKQNEKILNFWRKLGSKVEIMNARKHDETVSFASHLPHLVAFTLVNTLPLEYKKFVASGFKDTTRIAASDPLLWRDIFLTNKDSLLSSLKTFKNNLSLLQSALRNNKEKIIEDYLIKSSTKRNALK